MTAIVLHNHAIYTDSHGEVIGQPIDEQKLYSNDYVAVAFGFKGPTERTSQAWLEFIECKIRAFELGIINSMPINGKDLEDLGFSGNCSFDNGFIISAKSNYLLEKQKYIGGPAAIVELPLSAKLYIGTGGILLISAIEMGFDLIQSRRILEKLDRFSGGEICKIDGNDLTLIKGDTIDE